MEYDVVPNCPTAAFTAEVWLGSKSVEPERYFACKGAIYFSLTRSALRIFKGQDLHVGDGVLCGRQLPNLAFGGSSESTDAASRFNRIKRTTFATFQGLDYEVNAIMDLASKTLELSCTKNREILYSEHFDGCEQVIDEAR